MKSIIIKEPYNVEIIDEEIPKAGPGEIIVEAELSGISSGTEMMHYRGTWPDYKLKKWSSLTEYPFYPGYELAGKVIEVGPKKQESTVLTIKNQPPRSKIIITDTDDFKIGDRVICAGTHQQFAKVPVTVAAKIPDSVSYAKSTLAILGATTIHSTRMLQIEYGDSVAIIGLGIIGNLALQQAKLGGAVVTIGLDINEKRLEMARKVGADFLIQVGNDDPVKDVLKYTNNIGADKVIEASGVDGTLQLALDLMRDKGTVELLGWRTNESSFLYGDLYFKEGKIIATRASGPDPGIPYSYVRWGYDQNFKMAMKMIADGRLKTDFFQPMLFSYKDIKEVYKKIDKDTASVGLQAILEWK
jgi:L-iditol 2-dehydrogenase